MMPSIAQLCLVAGVCALALAAMHDLAVRTVPNVLIAALGGCALALAIVQHRLPASLAVAGFVLVLSFALWLRGYMGGADAKMLAASGLLLTPSLVLPMLLATALAGGVLCLPYLLGRRLLSPPPPERPRHLLSRLLRCERWRLRRRGPLPYAVAIAAGTLSALLHGA